jgi:hypothetical protein
VVTQRQSPGDDVDHGSDLDRLLLAAVTNTRDDGPNIDDMMWNVVREVTAWPNVDFF